MKSTRKIIKVFIGSPGDLTLERELARDVAAEYNANNSNLTGYQIDMVGWEETIGGIGRPQEIINKDLASCELFVGMLWKRWGTPPDKSGIYTSGFEEEFSLSFKKFQSEGVPQMLMLFKDVEKNLLQDPGVELKKVIDFKEKLIREKEVLYEVFNDARSFEFKLRRFLTNYVNELFESELSNPVSEGTDKNKQNKSSEVSIAEGEELSGFSNESTNFINKLAEEMKKDERNNLTSEDVAYFRLLASSLNKHGNDEMYLGAHDSNLIFLHKDKFDIGYRERLALASAGLDSFDNHNTPLWEWLDLDDVPVKIYLLYFEGKLKAKLIEALTLIGLELDEYRSEEVKDWFREGQSDEVKIAAAKYLANLGKVNDIPILTSEYNNKNYRTDALVREALILIEMRESVVKGFDKYIELQPSMLSAKALSYLREGQDSLDNERLYIGLSSKNTEIKLLCIDKLKERNLLSVDLIEKVIESDDYKLRLRALEYLSSANRAFYRDRAKSVLIIKNASSNNEEYYDQYISSCQVYEEYDLLVKENDKFSLSAIPLVCLAKLNKKKYLPLIRGILSNGCSDYYDKRLLSILPEGKTKDDFFSGSAKEFVTNRMTSELVTWLSSCMYKEDLMLIRSIVSNGNIYISSEVLDYFYKNGEWIDISLLSDANLQKRSASLLSFVDNNSAYARVADVALKIGKGREGELIDLNLNKNIIPIIISRLPAKSFKNLSDDKIVSLLNDYSSKIREKAALKSIDCLNKSRVKGLLKKLQLGDSYYYNSVHWLDMGISVKHDLIGRAVKTILKD